MSVEENTLFFYIQKYTEKSMAEKISVNLLITDQI